MAGISRPSGVAPPPPPRPVMPGEASSSPVMGVPVNAYSIPVGYPTYGGASFGGVGIYGNQMCGGYNSYGYTSAAESNFARLAEDSSRRAFQSIESVVMAVSSVANMLSSTHNAIYSSFRAVIGVVEQFSRLKSQLASLMVTLSVFRWLKRIWHALLVVLRLKPANYAVSELAWADANLPPTGADWLSSQGSAGKSVSWPTLLFWLVALGGPYLIYKCISSMVASVAESRKWATGCGEHYNAQALYDFTAQNDHEVSFRAGEILRVAPKHQQPPIRGWILGSSNDGKHVGLIPINYVKIISRKLVSPPPNLQDAFDEISEGVFSQS